MIRRGVATILNTLGGIYRNEKRFEEALESFSLAAEIWDENGDVVRYISAKNNIGNVHADMDDAEAAAEIYTELASDYTDAIAQYLAGEDDAVAARLLDGVGDLYRIRLNDLDLAIEAYQQAIGLWKALENATSEAASWTRLATVYRSTDNPGASIDALEQAISLYHDLGNYDREARQWLDLGKLYQEEQNYVPAIVAMYQARDLWEKEDGRESQVDSVVAQIREAYADWAVSLSQQDN